MNNMTSVGAVPRAGVEYWTGLLVIVIGLLFVRYIHFALTIGSDDQVWITVAKEIANSTQHTDAPVYYTRLLWTWLLIAWGWLGTLTLEWSAVLMFALSGLTMVMVAEAARRAFDSRTGLLAALIYGVHPLAIVYDTTTLPDVPAVLVLAAGMVLFVDFLRRGSHLQLIILGLLTGLLFGLKNYFVLFAIPCGLTIVMRPVPWLARAKSMALLVAGVSIGLLLTLLVGSFSGVETSSHAISVEQYTSYIAKDISTPVEYQGWRQLTGQILDRREYILGLFVRFGAVMGIVTLSGITLFLFRWQKAPQYTFFGATFGVFFLFLTFFPVRFSPLLFTQVQDRYLTVVLPALAISAAAAASEVWDRLNDRALRRAVFAVMAFVLAVSIYTPSNLHDRYRLLELRGLDIALTTSQSLGIERLALPADYRRLVPDSYRSRGVALEFRDYAAANVTMDLLASLKTNPTLAAIAFREPYRILTERLRTSDINAGATYGVSMELMTSAREQDLEIREIRVPYDTPRVWLARFGIRTRGQLVGWTISHRPKVASAS